MRDLSLHLLDLVQNSVRAGASLVTVTVSADEKKWITVSICDNGCGMSKELRERVLSPFATTRTTRKVGLGIPMIKELCELCEGSFGIESKLGEGTRLTLKFRKSNIDMPPMGSLADTMVALVNGSPVKPEFRLVYEYDGEQFEFDTEQIRALLEGVPLDTPDVLAWIRGFVIEGIEEAGYLP